MKLLKKNLQIGIDGPLGAGKSIAAKRLAERLGVLFVYTGAMYRAVALLGLRAGLDLENEEPLVKLLRKAKIELLSTTQRNRICAVLLNGEDVTEFLFTPRVSWGASQAAVFPKVREILVERQQKIAQEQPVVMEGRDITFRVLPKADLKIYMTADLKVRAQRRFKDLRKQGAKASLEEVIAETKKRDFQDFHRQADPLTKVEDAWVLDTTHMNIEEEIEAILAKLEEKKLVEL